MTYSCQAWSLSDTKLEALCISQKKMKRAFLGITLLDKKLKPGQISATIKMLSDNLHRWPWHLARFTDNRLKLSDSMVSLLTYSLTYAYRFYPKNRPPTKNLQPFLSWANVSNCLHVRVIFLTSVSTPRCHVFRGLPLLLFP